MISMQQVYGGSWRYAASATVKVHPDLARLYTLYPSADHDLTLPSPAEIKHWRPGPSMFVLVNQGLFDVTVKDHTGATVATMDHTGDEILFVDLAAITASSVTWSTRSRAL